MDLLNSSGEASPHPRPRPSEGRGEEEMGIFGSETLPKIPKPLISPPSTWPR